MNDEAASPSGTRGLHRLSMRHLAAVFFVLIVLGGALALTDPAARAYIESWYSALVPADASGARGALHLTLESQSRVSARTLDVTTGELVTQKLDGNRALEWVALSPTGDRRAYFIGKTDTESAAIRVESLATGVRTTVVSPVPESARAIRWSPDGEMLVFTAIVEESEGEYDYEPNDWAVYIVSARGGEMQRVALGTSPFFSPDGTIVLSLQNNGLYATSLADGSSKIVHAMEGGAAHRYMKIAPSPDGTHLLWTNLLSDNREGKIFIFNINSWNPITISKTAKVVNMPALHAVFSPDSAFIAFLTQPSDTSGSTPGVYVLDTSDLSTRQIFDLSGYDLSQTALTDWR